MLDALGRGRQQPPGQEDDDDPDREVDEEHQPPPEAGSAERDQQTTDDGPDRGAEPDRRAEQAERAAAVGPGEHLLHQAGHLGVDQPAEEPLQHTRADQDRRGRGQARQQRGDREAGHADLEHGPAPVVVSELAAEHRHQPEGERVARDDPLELRRACSGRDGDRRQRDVGDAHVEQRHEHRAAADDQRDPAGAVRHSGSTSSAVPSPATRVSTIVAAASPCRPRRRRRSSGTTSTPRFLIVSGPTPRARRAALSGFSR